MLRTRTVLAVAVIAATIAACGSDERPSVSDWQVEWIIDQSMMPTQDELLAGGQPLCDDLVGEFRSEFGELTPTPAETLDTVVEEWVSHAENIVFDCPTDEADVSARYEELDRITAEVVAGLDSLRSADDS